MAKKISQQMIDGVKDGVLTVDKIPTVFDYDSKLFKKPAGFDYKPQSYANAIEMISRAGHDLHHIIPKYIMKRLQALGIKPGLDLDATPGHLLEKAKHKKLTADMAKAITQKSMNGKSAAEIIDVLAQFYDNIGEPAQAAIVRAFF